MKVLFVNPPAYKKVEYVREGRCMQPKSVWNNIWPPLSLVSLATQIQDKYEVKVLDCIAEKIDFKCLKKYVETFSPKVIVINTGIPSLKGDLKVGEVAKAVDNKIVTIAFGMVPTLLLEETLNNYKIDVGIMYEPDITIKHIINAIDKKEDLNKVKGIAFKEKDKIIQTEKRELIKDLDKELEIPNRDLIKNELYTFPFDKKPFALLLLGRGCPYPCTYCISPVYYGNKYRTRDPKKVVDEMELCYKKYGIKNFIYWGESFTLNNDYGMKICAEIINRNLNFRWVTTSRVDTLSLELLKKMKQAGCYLLGLGIEHSNNKILKNTKKRATVEDSKNAIKLCKQAGIKTMGHFVFGLPGETKETAEELIKFSKTCGVNYAQFYCPVPYPKTEYWNQVKENNWIVSTDWDLYEQNYSVVKNDALTPEEIMEFRTRGFNEFYFRPKMIFQHILNLRSFKELKNTVISGIEVLKWFKPKKTLKI